MRRWHLPGAVVAAVVMMAAFPALPCAAQSGSAPSSEDREVLGGIAVWRSNPYSRRYPPDSIVVRPFIGFGGVRWIRDRLGVSGQFGFVGRRQVFFLAGARTRFFLSDGDTLEFGFSYGLGGVLAPEVLYGRRLSRRRSIKIGVTVFLVGGSSGELIRLYGTYPAVRLAQLGF